jgi:hypothetical protein
MKHPVKYIAGDMQSQKVEKGQAPDPYKTLETFFEYATLPQAADKLWQWLESTVTGSFNKELNCRERCNMVFFYRHMQQLVEAAHIIYNRQNKKRTANKKK